MTMNMAWLVQRFSRFDGSRYTNACTYRAGPASTRLSAQLAITCVAVVLVVPQEIEVEWQHTAGPEAELVIASARFSRVFTTCSRQGMQEQPGQYTS